MKLLHRSGDIVKIANALFALVQFLRANPLDLLNIQSNYGDLQLPENKILFV